MFWRKIFKPKSVADITSSLQTMMCQLVDHMENQNKKVQDIEKEILELNVEKNGAKSEIELAQKVHGNLQDIFK
jgi:hypothetical protein